MWVTSRSWCLSGLFRPKYNVKIRVLSSNLCKMGVPYGVFYSQASNKPFNGEIITKFDEIIKILILHIFC